MRHPLRALGVAMTTAVLAMGTVVLTPSIAGSSTPCPGMALTLSGGPSPATGIGTDDDLEVRLNGTPIFTDNDELATNNAPISFTAAFGDQLRVIASNSTVFGGHEGITPLYLHCNSNGATQVLDAVGFDAADGAGGHVFYDMTFTIDFALPTSQLTVSKVVQGAVPSGTTFTVAVDCDGTASDRTITFDSTGAAVTAGSNVIAVDSRDACTITETAAGGATSTAYACSENEHAGSKVCGATDGRVVVDFENGTGTGVQATATITNVFPAAAQAVPTPPPFTG